MQESNITLKPIHQKIYFLDPFSKIEDYYNNSMQLQNFGALVKFIDDNLLNIKISRLTELHLGGKGVNSVNGAVISYLFDLALGMTAYMARDLVIQSSVTSRLEIRFQKPLITNEIMVYAKINETKRNLIYSEAWITDELGKVSASAEGVLYTK